MKGQLDRNHAILQMRSIVDRVNKDQQSTESVQCNFEEVAGKQILPWSLHVQMVGISFFFYGFYGFLRTINLRSRLTILSNLNSVGR